MKVNRILLILTAFAAVAIVGVVVGGGSFLGSGEEQIETQIAGEQATPIGLAPAAKDAPSGRPASSAGAPVQAADPSRPVAKPAPILLLNPAIGAPGSAVGISGSGFDPGATVDVILKRSEADKGEDIGFAQTDQGGSFGGLNFSIPEGTVGGTFLVIAQQEKSDKKAIATGQVQGASPSAKFGTQVGKPGDQVAVTAKGFAPGEKVKVFFNTISSEAVAELQADQGGSLGRASITVPYGAVGNNAFILMGEKSQSPVTLQFQMLSFYPSAGLNVYAAKPDTAVTFSGTDFGPDENVSIFLNSLQSPPVAIVQTNAEGAFTNTGQFIIPFSLNGKNTFVFVGEKSQSAVTAGFDVLPYTPYAEASTYGARPGTTLAFYGRDFARNEVVRVYVGRSRNSAGQEVSCFKTDDRGAVSGSGAYTIPHNAQAGKTSFSLIGDKSKNEALVAFQIMDPGGPVAPSPEEAKQFRCPFDDEAAAAGQSAPPEGQAPVASPPVQSGAADKPAASQTPAASQSSLQQQQQAPRQASPTAQPAQPAATEKPR